MSIMDQAQRALPVAPSEIAQEAAKASVDLGVAAEAFTLARENWRQAKQRWAETQARLGNMRATIDEEPIAAESPAWRG